MKHFKDAQNNLFAYERDGSQDELISDDLIEISFEEMNNIRQKKMDIEAETLSYSEKRRREYPALTVYLDGLVKNDHAQMEAYINACRAIKQKYPKP